ncbi:hypothetical protein EDEG_00894 [Edhazardia aedis USNM 41457]|uniref:Uncharacterized protein n=1 Tax=Edhazardia aedis (strain USNM 41457) TaxID=1003232 RepID=J9DBZ1_EDHAE|nr:hypothetical protein EDEG_00894 [Edhazardia aedis USNM 41457]|eukprot:EJW05014.1 hypothetical protein EDEG_00894 [Edhazardia aedis USNM 41457]
MNFTCFSVAIVLASNSENIYHNCKNNFEDDYFQSQALESNENISGHQLDYDIFGHGNKPTTEHLEIESAIDNKIGGISEKNHNGQVFLNDFNLNMFSSKQDKPSNKFDYDQNLNAGDTLSQKYDNDRSKANFIQVIPGFTSEDSSLGYSYDLALSDISTNLCSVNSDAEFDLLPSIQNYENVKSNYSTNEVNKIDFQSEKNVEDLYFDEKLDTSMAVSNFLVENQNTGISNSFTMSSSENFDIKNVCSTMGNFQYPYASSSISFDQIENNSFINNYETVHTQLPVNKNKRKRKSSHTMVFSLSLEPKNYKSDLSNSKINENFSGSQDIETVVENNMFDTKNCINYNCKAHKIDDNEHINLSAEDHKINDCLNTELNTSNRSTYELNSHLYESEYIFFQFGQQEAVNYEYYFLQSDMLIGNQETDQQHQRDFILNSLNYSHGEKDQQNGLIFSEFKGKKITANEPFSSKEKTAEVTELSNTNNKPYKICVKRPGKKNIDLLNEIENSLNITNKIFTNSKDCFMNKGVNIKFFYQEKLNEFESESKIVIAQAKVAFIAFENFKKSETDQNYKIAIKESLKIFVNCKMFDKNTIKISQFWLVLSIFYPEIPGFIRFLANKYFRVNDILWSRNVNLKYNERFQNRTQSYVASKDILSAKKASRQLSTEYKNLENSKSCKIYEAMADFLRSCKMLINFQCKNSLINQKRMILKKPLCLKDAKYFYKNFLVQTNVQAQRASEAFFELLLSFPDKIIGYYHKIFYYKFCSLHKNLKLSTKYITSDFFEFFKLNFVFDLTDTYRKDLEDHLDNSLGFLFFNKNLGEKHVTENANYYRKIRSPIHSFIKNTIIFYDVQNIFKSIVNKLELINGLDLNDKSVKEIDIDVFFKDKSTLGDQNFAEKTVYGSKLALINSFSLLSTLIHVLKAQYSDE